MNIKTCCCKSYDELFIVCIEYLRKYIDSIKHRGARGYILIEPSEDFVEEHTSIYTLEWMNSYRGVDIPLKLSIRKNIWASSVEVLVTYEGKHYIWTTIKHESFDKCQAILDIDINDEVSLPCINMHLFALDLVKHILAVSNNMIDEDIEDDENEDSDKEDNSPIINTSYIEDSRLREVLNLILHYGQIEGDHHRAWVIDQITRILLGDEYKIFVKGYERNGEYEWYTGIAP